jgi:hypothetical protein
MGKGSRAGTLLGNHGAQGDDELAIGHPFHYR